MKRTYLDNGSTSYPKAPGVSDAVKNFMDNIGTNINRGGYEDAYLAEDGVIGAREKLCRLFHFSKVKNVIFTPNITYSLNMIIKGFLRPGDHVLVSSIEHNAMMRPLTQMLDCGVTFDRIPCNSDGELQTDQLEAFLRPNTRAVMMTHASNVSGTLLPIREVGVFCAQHGLRFVVDAAQTAGVFPIDMEEMQIDALAFTGHKSLLGPQGIGGFLITDEMAQELRPLITGGTGSVSDSEIQPNFLPDKFESGTMNLPGIYGLSAALDYLEQQGIDSIRRHEMELTGRFMDAVERIDGVKLIGPRDLSKKGPVISLDFPDRDNAEIAFCLDSEYGISTRCGLHCAPHAHKTLGTYPQGTVRFTMGHQNTAEEADYAANAIKEILARNK